MRKVRIIDKSSLSEGSHRRLGWTVLFSILFHITLLMKKITVGALNAPTPNERIVELTEIPKEWLNQAPRTKLPDTKLKEMAETEKAPNQELDPNAQFLSDRSQRIEKQTRVKLIDAFRKKQGTGAPPKAAESPEKSEELSEGILQSLKHKSPASPKDWKSLSLQDLGVIGGGGPAGATDDRLKGVDEGERTILSTREYRYFSYYHRIKEMLRQYWKPNVERKLERLWRLGKMVGEEEMTTRLLILLNEDGKISKISRVGSCGILELDEAAVEAFQQAAPFPNPPPGIIDSDGFVRIHWDFILKTEASPRIQFQTTRRPNPY